MLRWTAILLLSGALMGCAATETKQSASLGDAAGVVCTEPRPMVCTMEYRPVCADLQNGNQETYASGCNACADVAVVSWTPNACEDQ